MSVAIVAGLLFAVLTVLVAAPPGAVLLRPSDRGGRAVGQRRTFGWFNTFVSAFSGFVGVGVGAAVIAITFLLRRPATPLVAFSAIYCRRVQRREHHRPPAPTQRRCTHHLQAHRLQLSRAGTSDSSSG